ncbi:hypothetical protein WJX79_008774 [Trebouxia sp. C0005]
MVQANYSAAQVPVGTVPVASPSTTSANKVNQAVTEVLTLRLAPRRKAKAVRWSEEVVDNESMNKKKSKKCCIFHKQKSFGDWSDTDSDDECNGCNKQADCGQSDDKQETQS